MPVAKWQKINLKGNLHGCRTISTLPHNYRGVTTALYAFKWLYNWVVGLRHDYSTSITPEWLNNNPSGQIANNQTNRQLKLMSRNNHITIQLQRCYYCFICFQRAMQLSGWSKAWLLCKHYTIIAPNNTTCGKMAKNQTNGQLELLSCNNHITIQL